MVHAPSLVLHMTVLVADDDEDMRALVAKVLRDDGHEVIEASDGEELLGILEGSMDDLRQRPSMVLTDVRMPRLSGLGVLAALRRAGVEMPVVLMTVLADDSVYILAKTLGAVGVLRKPFDPDDLRTAIANAVTVNAQASRLRARTRARLR